MRHERLRLLQAFIQWSEACTQSKVIRVGMARLRARSQRQACARTLAAWKCWLISRRKARQKAVSLAKIEGADLLQVVFACWEQLVLVKEEKGAVMKKVVRAWRRRACVLSAAHAVAMRYQVCVALFLCVFGCLDVPACVADGAIA
jgi:hypothetical protein